MSAKKKTRGSAYLLGYTYPVLHQGKVNYVDFYALDPLTNELKRKKYYIPTSTKKSQIKSRAAELITTLTNKLSKGWSPWVDKDSNKSYTLLKDCTPRYLAFLNKLDRVKTRDNYSSRLKIMLEYNETRNKPISYVYQFNSEFIRDFLDWLYLERECSERTVNNYRGWCSSLAEWMIERHYLDTNPVANINKLRAKPKKRKDLSKEMLTTLFDYLNRTDKYLLLACMFEYYTFIRPTELSYIQLKDINVSKHTVFVPATVSKNKRDANVGLNDTIIKLMLDLKVFEHPADHYLFSKDLMPGWRRVDPDIFNKRWASMRKKLGWDANVKFYSLKDSGIRDLANARGIVIARDQARHTDVSTTNKYLQGHDMRIHNETTTFVGALAPDED